MVLWKFVRRTVVLVMVALASASGALAHIKNEQLKERTIASVELTASP